MHAEINLKLLLWKLCESHSMKFTNEAMKMHKTASEFSWYKIIPSECVSLCRYGGVKVKVRAYHKQLHGHGEAELVLEALVHVHLDAVQHGHTHERHDHRGHGRLSDVVEQQHVRLVHIDTCHVRSGGKINHNWFTHSLPWMSCRLIYSSANV